MHRKVDRPLRLFHRRRAIALFGIERSIALSSYFSKNGDQSPKLKVGPIAILVTNVFAGKSDRPSSIPDAKPAIALFVGNVFAGKGDRPSCLPDAKRVII